MLVEVNTTIRPKDAYTWHVQYQDGTATDEYDEARPDGRGWAEIGEKPVKDVWLMGPDLSVHSGYKMNVPQGATPVFFRRRRAVINLNNDSMTGQGAIHCIGWTRGEKGVYLFVFDDGSTLLTDDLEAVHHGTTVSDHL